MRDDRSMRRYRACYARLLRLHSPAFRERFGEGMAQTFNDLLRERAREGRCLFGCALWMFVETFAGIVRENGRSTLMKYKRIAFIALVTACILMVPLLANQFVEGANWGPEDFIVAGALLFGTGLAFDLTLRKGGGRAYRAAMSMAISTALLLVWVNLAVGVIGNEGNPINLAYFAIIFLGMLGALIARFRPQAMAVVLFIAGVAQFAVPLVALLIGALSLATPELVEGAVRIFVFNSVFAALFIGSAFLFHRASHGINMEPRT